MNKELKVRFMMLKDKNIENEVKVMLLLEMVHAHEITLNKAKELCTEIGIFSDHWFALDAKATETFSALHENMN